MTRSTKKDDLKAEQALKDHEAETFGEIPEDDPFPPAFTPENYPSVQTGETNGDSATSAEQLNLYQRMHAIMTDVSYIQKENRRVNNQYQFVSHDRVMSVIHPALVKHRVLMLPSVLNYVCRPMGDAGKHDSITEVTVRVTFVNIDRPIEQFSIDMTGFGWDNFDKGIGKAVSYAVKYAILKAFSLETGEDPDSDAAPESYSPPTAKVKTLDVPMPLPDKVFLGSFTPEGDPFLEARPAASSGERVISEKQVKFLWVQMKKHGMQPVILQTHLKEALGVDDFTKIPMSKMEDVLKWIQESNPF